MSRFVIRGSDIWDDINIVAKFKSPYVVSFPNLTYGKHGRIIDGEQHIGIPKQLIDFLIRQSNKLTFHIPVQGRGGCTINIKAETFMKKCIERKDTLYIRKEDAAEDYELVPGQTSIEDFIRESPTLIEISGDKNG